jgi:glycerophosphoryl diester phosphodiesterase
MRINRWLSSLVVAAVTASTAVTATPIQAQAGQRAFDLQAHRGGLGLRPESTLSAFANALHTGVSTLELDVQITEDRQAVVTHDRRTDARKCLDTAPASPGDPEFPYVGKYVNTLTLAQLRTLDCGSRTLPEFPAQQASPGARMPLLSEVFDLVKTYRADRVSLNVETKVEAGAPTETAPREQFVQVVAREVRAAGFLRRVTIQSFDWGSLMRMRQVEPRLPLVALTNIDFLQTGQPGASPWLGGLDIDDFGGDPIAAIDSFGATTFSPVHGTPQGGAVGDPGYRPYVTRSLVKRAHRAGIKVVPWTVDDPATMNKLISDGVDGLITDYPDRLREVLAERGFRLPPAYSVVARPLGRAHAHNDYEHENPLFDALEHGFTSVEADIYLVGGELLVGHDPADLVPGRTLQKLYLDPLLARAAAHHGRIYPDRRASVQLLIDIKNTGAATYTELDRVLRGYRLLLTRYAHGRVTEGAVTAVISGDRPRELMAAQPVRYAFYDGRLADLGTGAPASFMPLISDNWSTLFTWMGDGPMPAAERARLRDIVSTAHRDGQRVRFWATPDTPGPQRAAVWRELVAAGVDHLNTDDLAGLEDFLRAGPA